MVLYRGTGSRLVKSVEALGRKRAGAADEKAAALVKTEEATGSSGDADARAFAEEQRWTGALGGGAGETAQPQRAWRAQVYAIKGAIDEKRGGQATGTAG